jgi:hypothetical protein
VSFPPPYLRPVGPTGVPADEFGKAVRYIRHSRNGARVIVRVHAPDLTGDAGVSEQSQADDVARDLIRHGVPAGSITIQGVHEREGESVWISIIVERLKRL